MELPKLLALLAALLVILALSEGVGSIHTRPNFSVLSSSFKPPGSGVHEAAGAAGCAAVDPGVGGVHRAVAGLGPAPGQLPRWVPPDEIQAKGTRRTMVIARSMLKG